MSFYGVTQFLGKLKAGLEFVRRVLQKFPSLKVHYSSEKDTQTAVFKTDKERSSFSVSVIHKKSKVELNIGFMVENTMASSLKLFFSFSMAQALVEHVYINGTLPYCTRQEWAGQSGDEVIAFVVDDSYNDEFFDEATSDERKEQIVSEILSALDAKIEAGE